MKKIFFLLLLLPFIINAQTPAGKNEVSQDIIKNEPGGEQSKKQAKEKLEDIRQKVIKGELSMATAASLYSEDPGSIKTGGRYDNISHGMFVAEFENVAFNMQPGDLSEVFETDYGFHFIQLIARHDELVDVRHILIKPK